MGLAKARSVLSGKSESKETGMSESEVPWLNNDEQYLFSEGSYFRSYEKLGAHLCSYQGQKGAYFAVWAPNAESVSVLGDFNRWSEGDSVLEPTGTTGIWHGFVADANAGQTYKYRIRSNAGGQVLEKADPYAFYSEVAPRTASRLWPLDSYGWNDDEWMRSRKERQAHDSPISVYEMHIGSWRRKPEENNRSLSYRELAEQLPEYLSSMGFTHVQFMPVMEHPFEGSWGYQQIGYFAPTSRYGTPEDFKFLVDTLHEHEIGVLVDWVPGHFPTDAHGLGNFDGTHLYEHADPKEGFHPDWQTYIFNYGRREVSAFLISSALFWLDKYHIDGIRVDAVASMLYRDYSRKEGEWVPNCFGGRENLEAVAFLKRFNEVVYAEYPDTLTAAEESTSYPMVSRPTSTGGLGFGFKWNMGWMNDTLRYFSKEPVHRSHHHNDLTFGLLYAFTENFILPLSHDEVVHGKGSLIGRMPGDTWQRFANLRALYGLMFAHPGKKLLFMGAEFAQWDEWDHDASLDWHLTEHDMHQGVSRWVSDLNQLYLTCPALHENDFEPEGFSWVEGWDTEQSVLSWLRFDRSREEVVLAVGNFTPVPREQYRLGVPAAGFWREELNSDATLYSGSGIGNFGGVEAEQVASHNFDQSVVLTVPPLAVSYFRLVRD